MRETATLQQEQLLLTIGRPVIPLQVIQHQLTEVLIHLRLIQQLLLIPRQATVRFKLFIQVQGEDNITSTATETRVTSVINTFNKKQFVRSLDKLNQGKAVSIKNFKNQLL